MVAYRCEVVIVGGGILGCWVLDELLRRGYRSSILLEHDRLGCRQTGHSDAFLHQGYAYYGAKPSALVNSWSLWNVFQPSPNPPIPPILAHHVFLRGASPTPTLEYTNAMAWCGAQYPAVPAPLRVPMVHPDIAPQHTHDAIETNERCVPAEWVLEQFRAKNPGHFCKVARVEKISLTTDPGDAALRVRAVLTRLDDGADLEIQPAVLLLCAGEQNRDLLRRVEPPAGTTLPGYFNELDELHRVKEMDLLVIRDPSGTLPLFNGSVLGGMFTDDQGASRNVWAFIVSRTERQEHVWICSGGVSGNPRPVLLGKEFRRRLIDHLRAVFAVLGNLQSRLEWGVYSGRLATLGPKFSNPADPGTLGVQRHHDMGVGGLLVCYTDRLTIAPLAARRVAATVAASLPSTGAALPAGRLPAVEVNPDYWRAPILWERRGLMKWAEFALDCL